MLYRGNKGPKDQGTEGVEGTTPSPQSGHPGHNLPNPDGTGIDAPDSIYQDDLQDRLQHPPSDVTNLGEALGRRGDGHIDDGNDAGRRLEEELEGEPSTVWRRDGQVIPGAI